MDLSNMACTGRHLRCNGLNRRAGGRTIDHTAQPLIRRCPMLAGTMAHIGRCNRASMGHRHSVLHGQGHE